MLAWLLDETTNPNAAMVTAISGAFTAVIYAISELRKSADTEARLTKLETQMEERKK